MVVQDSPIPEPQRQADLARLFLTRLNVEEKISLIEFFQKTSVVCADFLNVERVGIWLLVNEGKALRCVELFEKSKKNHIVGPTLIVADYPSYFSSISQRKTLPIESVETDPRTQELLEGYLRPLKISSMLDGPIYINGELVGIICHEHTGPVREWSTEERDFVGSIADIIALKIRAAEMGEVRIALRTQESQLAEYRRMDAITQMAAGVAHDFKNILNVILGSAELISFTEGLPDSVQAMVKDIITATNKGTALAQELMEFARPTPHSTRVLNVAQTIQNHLEVLQSSVGPNHQVQLDLLSRTGSVFISSTQLERMMLNLVVNARDAMPQGGTIFITVDSVIAKDHDNREGPFIEITGPK